MCYVLPYVWSILVIPNQTVRLPDDHSSSSLMSQGLLEPLAVASSHIVLLCTSHQVFMPAVAMWPYLSPWPSPYCVPVPLTVTKRLLGANPSCHSHQWIIATNLSPFMTHAHIRYQLHTQQTAPYTHSLPPAQWITSNVLASRARGATQSIKNQLIVLQFGGSRHVSHVKPMERCEMALLVSRQYGGGQAWKGKRSQLASQTV